ncbi:LuxR C-terminal-related transcriptional regulator [Streptomyces sp. NPDC093065]|uniref:LuxR C-terminal-related transcriptional regulator n=1 Tax=Streptomyces sp. NPDC093065 TaxID=3366021 RepID=UPI003811976C
MAAWARRQEGGTLRPPSEPLTQREKEAAALIAAGLTNTEIGEELFVSLATVNPMRPTSNAS